MDGPPACVLQQPLARRSDAGQSQIDGSLTSVVGVKRILRGSEVQKLFGKTPAFLGWAEAELVGGYSLEIVLRAGLSAFPFSSKGGNSIHVGDGK
jgi:hypothetical protein